MRLRGHDEQRWLFSHALWCSFLFHEDLFVGLHAGMFYFIYKFGDTFEAFYLGSNVRVLGDPEESKANEPVYCPVNAPLSLTDRQRRVL